MNAIIEGMREGNFSFAILVASVILIWQNWKRARESDFLKFQIVTTIDTIMKNITRYIEEQKKEKNNGI